MLIKKKKKRRAYVIKIFEKKKINETRRRNFDKYSPICNARSRLPTIIRSI